MEHRRVKDQLYAHFARIGRAVASPKRLELLDLLAQCERPVESLADEAHLTVGNTSAHLKVLHAARLVERRREGHRVYYRLSSPAVIRLFHELEALGEAHLAEVEQLVQRYLSAPDEFEQVTPTELVRRLRAGDVLVLDVRPPEEYAAGHVPGALNVPPGELARRLAALPRDREVVAYCRGPYCLFSVEAAALLRRRGYRVRRLAGGFPAWRARGKPVATGTGAADRGRPAMLGGRPATLKGRGRR